MTHIFKPGDRAYSLRTLRWVDLVENRNDIKALYPLKEKDSDETYTQDGRYNKMQVVPCLIPLNPYDPTDPLNPPEFRYPFVLNGRPVRIGDQLKFVITKDISVLALSLEGGERFIYSIGTRISLNSADLCWPDELPQKKEEA